MTLGERIKEQRKRCGLSQEKVAELVGVSRQAVTKWESGQSAPSTENLFRLAEIFGTTVDLLLDADARETNFPAEQSCRLCKAEEEQSAVKLRIRRKRNFLAALSVAGGYLAVYLLGRVVWCSLSESSLMGWLFFARPKGEHSYLYGWLLSSRLFWYAMTVSVLPAIFGKLRFSLTTLAGFVLGLLAGMAFGPNPGGAATGHTHDGWLIWGVVFLVSAAAGIVAEKCGKRRADAHP